MSEAVKGLCGTFCVGLLAGRGGAGGVSVAVSGWKLGFVTKRETVVVVSGRLVVLCRLRGGPNLFNRAATSGGIFGWGGGPRLAKDGGPLGRSLGFSTWGGPNFRIRASTSGGRRRPGARLPVGALILRGARAVTLFWGDSVGGLTIGATVVTIVVVSSGVGIVENRPWRLRLRVRPMIFCLCFGWILLFWNRRAGGKISGLGVVACLLFATSC